MTEDRWEPKIAADRLADYLTELLDFVGRVDQGVSTGDLFYVADKIRAVIRVAERMQTLVNELVEEDTNVHPYLPRIEATLVRAGQIGYRAAAALHPSVPR